MARSPLLCTCLILTVRCGNLDSIAVLIQRFSESRRRDIYPAEEVFQLFTFPLVCRWKEGHDYEDTKKRRSNAAGR